MTHQTRTKSLLTTLILTTALGTGALSFRSLQATSQTDGTAAAAVPAVDITLIEQKPVRLWTEFSARLSAVEEVRLRPQVSGSIVEIRFEDGQRVSNGDVLFVIDPRPYQAAVAQAKAEVAAAQERHNLAGKELQRARALSQSSSISKSVLDERSNDVSVLQNEIMAAEAKLDDARIDLDHAFVNRGRGSGLEKKRLCSYTLPHDPARKNRPIS